MPPVAVPPPGFPIIRPPLVCGVKEGKAPESPPLVESEDMMKQATNESRTTCYPRSWTEDPVIPTPGTTPLLVVRFIVGRPRQSSTSRARRAYVCLSMLRVSMGTVDVDDGHGESFALLPTQVGKFSIPWRYFDTWKILISQSQRPAERVLSVIVWQPFLSQVNGFAMIVHRIAFWIRAIVSHRGNVFCNHHTVSTQTTWKRRDSIIVLVA